jgi:hypothetical protein
MMKVQTSFRNKILSILRDTVKPLSGVPQTQFTWLVVTTVILSIALIFAGWNQGITHGFSLSSYLPMNDALGYQSCAASLAVSGKGSYFEPWCTWRAIYPSMLATFLSVTGWYGQIALILQAVLTSLAILAISIQIARIMGWLTALMAMFLIGAFAWRYVYWQYMTEVAGLLFGLIGSAILLRFASTKRNELFLVGIALISIGMSARAGALLILPAIVIWHFFMMSNNLWKRRVLSTVFACIAVSVGPLLQLCVLLSIGQDPEKSGGNFSVVLYGLSRGSRDWTQAYKDFPDLFPDSFWSAEKTAFHKVYNVAIENIFANPLTFIDTLWQAAKAYSKSLFKFGVLTNYNIPLTLLLIFGLIACLYHWRKPVCSLLLVMAVAEFISAPIIFDSGYHRVFATSFALRAILAAFGLRVIVIGLLGILSEKKPPPINQQYSADNSTVLALVLGCITFAAIMLPLTPIGNLFQLDPIPGLGCPQGTNEVVARLDLESQTLGIVSSHTGKSVFPYRISREQLLSDPVLPKFWRGSEFFNLPENSLVITAIQRLEGDLGAIKFIIWNGELPASGPGTVSMCVDNVQKTPLAGDDHFRAIKMRPL